jgi:hypothetical protein
MRSVKSNISPHYIDFKAIITETLILFPGQGDRISAIPDNTGLSPSPWILLILWMQLLMFVLLLSFSLPTHNADFLISLCIRPPK